MAPGPIRRKGPRPASLAFEALQPTVKSMNRPLSKDPSSKPQYGNEGGAQLQNHMHGLKEMDWNDYFINTSDEFGGQSMSSTPEDFGLDFYNNSMLANHASSSPIGTPEDFHFDFYSSSVSGYEASSSPPGNPEDFEAAFYKNSMPPNDASIVPAHFTRVVAPNLASYPSSRGDFLPLTDLAKGLPPSAQHSHAFWPSQQQDQHGVTYVSASENRFGSINGVSYGGVLASTNGNHDPQYSLLLPPKVVDRSRFLPEKVNGPPPHTIFPPTPSPYRSPYFPTARTDSVEVSKSSLSNAFPFEHHIDNMHSDELVNERVSTGAQAEYVQTPVDVPGSDQSQVEGQITSSVHAATQAKKRGRPRGSKNKHSPVEKDLHSSNSSKETAARTKKPWYLPPDSFGFVSTSLSEASRICQVLAAAKEAGFDCLEDVLAKLYTAELTGYSKAAQTCRQEQALGWAGRVETLIGSLMTSTTNFTSEPYERAVLKAATPLFQKEFENLSKEEAFYSYDLTADGRLQKESKVMVDNRLSTDWNNITPNFLASNVLKDTEKYLREKIPHLWNLLSTCTSNPDKSHINALALGMLFQARRYSANRIQYMLGFWLQGKGASKDIIIQLSRCGLTVCHESLRRAAMTLADHQLAILQHAGKEPTSELRFRYDNFLNANSNGINRQRQQEIDASPATAFMATHMGSKGDEVELPVDTSSMAELIKK